jgi:mono/diheme cytochrome c family protein
MTKAKSPPPEGSSPQKRELLFPGRRSFFTTLVGIGRACVGLFMGGLIVLGAMSYYDHNPLVARQLAFQGKQVHDFMRAPFKPESRGVAAVGTATSGAASADGSISAQGQKIFQSHSCYACHGRNGAGTPMAPRLAGIGSKYTPEQLLNLFNHPSPAMDSGGMPHFQFHADDVNALIAYLDSQH